MMKPLVLERPGYPAIAVTDLFLDFTGTLSKDGKLIEGVSERLHALSKLIRITVLTADTFGTARSELAGLPVELKTISSALDKGAAVKQSGPDNVAAIGNGVNDVAMVRDAALGIAVIGPEGAAGELILVADVVVRDILDGLDLLLTPRRFKATLRA